MMMQWMKQGFFTLDEIKTENFCCKFGTAVFIFMRLKLKIFVVNLELLCLFLHI